ncbi:MAG: hypothetical protein P1V20_19525 [Verrucomicrobiales bacterium]|nr:hypothetical protein [Verrucomicrobiales bacterium]
MTKALTGSSKRPNLVTLIVYPSIVLIIGLISFSVSLKWKLEAAKADSDLNSYPKIEDFLEPPAPKKVDTYGLDYTVEKKEPIKVSLAPDFKNEVAPISLETTNQKTAKVPELSYPGGVYPEASFPMRLQISNPNPLSTWVMVSMNGRSFIKYNYQTLYIDPGDTITAYVRGDTIEWEPSEIVEAKYYKQQKVKKYRAPVRRITFQ